MRPAVGARLAGVALALAACAPSAASTTLPGDPGAGAGAAGAAADVPAPPAQAAVPATAPAGDAAAPADVPWEPGVVEAPPAGEAPWGVWIPRLDVAAGLVPLGLDDAGALEVPSDPHTAGWYVGGPRPGEVGPTVVAGHVDSRTGPAVFARLHELREGDLAHLVYRDGFVVTYRVSSTARVDKDGFPTAAVYGDTPAPTLRLITCGGAFDRSAGSYRDNVVVFADVLGTWRYDPAAA